MFIVSIERQTTEIIRTDMIQRLLIKFKVGGYVVYKIWIRKIRFIIDDLFCRAIQIKFPPIIWINSQATSTLQADILDTGPRDNEG